MPPKQLSPSDSEVIAHLSNLQGIIHRMAANSALCKTLCVALVAGLAAFSGAVKKGDLILLAAIPTVLFCYLDCVYLSLERDWRENYNDFVERLHNGYISQKDVFTLKPSNSYDRIWLLGEAFVSWSVWPVYCPLLAIIFLIRHLYH